MGLDFVTNQEVIMAARRNLTDNVWHYLTGGAESETTMRRNRHGLDGLAFRPRVLVDVSEVDPSTTFLEHKLKTPVMLAPIGSLQSITAEGGCGRKSRGRVRHDKLCQLRDPTEPRRNCLVKP